MAGCDAAEVFELADEAFDLIAFAVKGLRKATAPFAVGAGRILATAPCASLKSRMRSAS